jgi:hypothetical protein
MAGRAESIWFASHAGRSMAPGRVRRAPCIAGRVTARILTSPWATAYPWRRFRQRQMGYNRNVRFSLRRMIRVPAAFGKKVVGRRRGRARPAGRGGPEDQPVASGGDGFQTEPPAVRE